MSQDVFEMMQKMNLHSVETQMAIQCAPVFAGLKMSNLLIVAKEDICKQKFTAKHSELNDLCQHALKSFCQLSH